MKLSKITYKVSKLNFLLNFLEEYSIEDTRCGAHVIKRWSLLASTYNK
jgi:hypothetical protein